MTPQEFIDFVRSDFDLTPAQEEQFLACDALYRDWNAKINVISRKDIDNLYDHHLLHSLAIARYLLTQPETLGKFRTADVLDLGTGGGFPGIPLAIMFPDAKFYLVDSIGKKIKVVSDVAQQLDLTNVRAEQIRAEQVQGDYDFIVSRAVTDLSQFMGWIRGKVSPSLYHPLHNGVLYLKGGDLTEELAPFRKKAHLYNIDEFFEEPYFETKKVIHIPVGKSR